MKDGLLFIQITSSFHQFFSHMFDVTFSMLGYYYTEKQTYLYLIDITTGKTPNWLSMDMTIENLEKHEKVESITRIECKNKKEFRKCQLDWLKLSYTSQNVIDKIFTLLNNTECKEKIDVDELYGEGLYGNYEKYVKWGHGIGFRRKKSLFLDSNQYESCSHKVLRKSKVGVDINRIKNWLKEQIDKLESVPIDNIITDDEKLRQYLESLCYDIRRGEQNLVLNLNYLLECFNENRLTPIKKLKGEYTIPIVGVISENFDTPLHLKFENQDFEIITTECPRLERFTVDQLKEILLTLDVVGNQRFEQLRLNIVKRLVELEKPPEY